MKPRAESVGGTGNDGSGAGVVTRMGEEGVVGGEAGNVGMWARQATEASQATAPGPAMAVGVPRSLGAAREVGCGVMSSRELSAQPSVAQPG
jgi:hypothetical protein